MTYANYNNRIVRLNYDRRGNLPGRYITATICKILGYSNECFVLTEMRSFEDKVPETNETKKWLRAFDVAEPIIAQKIEEEYETTQDKNTWVQVYNLFLSETASLMGSQKYPEAIGNYQRMMSILRQYFKIEEADLVPYQQENDRKEREYSKLKIIMPFEKVAIEQ